jgi:hypothetical protein
LRFQKPHSSLAQISLHSIQGLALGEEDKQVGGVPMMLAKAAAPYQSGTVISLFSHKKYDTVTLEYLDSNEAFHGVIFQLNRGKGQILKSELEAEGAHVGWPEDETTQGTKNELRSNNPTPQRWSVQVEKVQPGDVNIEPAFRIAIYENLLQELAKTKQFKDVFRSGERTADGVPDVLVLKTTVERYTPGSETMRAVTTVFGATKLKVRTLLSTREGQVVLERELNGNVRLIGDNLRATHNLAQHIAAAIKQTPLPEREPSTGTTAREGRPGCR